MAPVWRRRLLIALCLYLAVEFTIGAVTKFWPGETFFGPAYSVKFVEWGYPSWFRFVIGAGELFAAVLLVIPRRRFRFMASALLVVILIGAVITHIVSRDPLYESVSAPIHLAIMAALAWASRPAEWSELWRPRGDERPRGMRGATQRT
ncbi:DoxX family protein [Nonomuraea sp. NPDC049152]|uniref:DoxX family protein n=1 Tax=Nonomuraea sp. NPDC049152 TaxID=3154350 RepID=UPI0033DB2AF0